MTVRFFPVASTREKVEESVKTVVNRILEQIANQSIVQSLELVYEKNRVDLTVLLRGERAADVSYFFEKLVSCKVGDFSRQAVFTTPVLG